VSTRVDHREDAEDVSLVAALPGLARIGAVASIRFVEWTAGAYVRTVRGLVRSAARGEPPADILQRAGDEVLTYLRELLVVSENGAGPVAARTPPASGPVSADGDGPEAEAEIVPARPRATDEALRERGAALLRRSAEIDDDAEDEAHPAYVRVLEEIAPDEARILRLLALEGAQPAVDVRTGGALGKLKDELVAPGLNMLAMDAGLRRADLVHRQLDNLYRLGLIWFSREELDNQARYQVLEAQPDVLDAMTRAGRARTVRRSITLTPFGSDFCRTCLPLDTAEIDALDPDA
jgi:Abortive infection alpha